MPQLDFATYLYQFNWFLLVFFVFYICVLKYILPTISAVMKARSKKLILDRKDVLAMNSQRRKVSKNSEILWETALRTSEKQLKTVQSLHIAALFQQANDVLKALK